ncbi:MAG TPA: putative lipid II flippase FtsW [Gaiellaceae bacterium]|jgi:cell division protein FtsW|nr:putative lipid II flippase FtsW [Gaiellaceae bacterium]
MRRRTGQRPFEWQLLVLVTLALTAFGLVMVYSATSASAALGHANPTGYLERQATYALVGLGLLVVAARTDFRKLRPLAPMLVLSALALCLAVLVIGTRVNGARRWIGFGPATFQPSELAKLALVVWCAAYLARRPAPRTPKDLARPIGLLVGLFCLLVLVEPDLGTVITIVVMVGAMLLVAGTPLPTLAFAFATVAGLGTVAAWSSPYRRARLFTFLDPWKDPLGAGLQNVQAQISLGSGGIFGRGLGQGIEKIHYLPEAHTDMIFAVIGEELGLVGAAVLMLGYCAFAYAGLRLAIGCKDPFGKRLAAGITALVCGQAAINLAAVLGLAPLTGIPLPFVSYGGSSLVVALLSVGVLLNIARGHGGTQTASVPDRGRRNGGARRPVARSGGSAAHARRDRDVRRVAGSRRGAARS